MPLLEIAMVGLPAHPLAFQKVVLLAQVGPELWNGSATPGTRTDWGPGARLMSGALHGDAQRRGGVCLPVNPLIFPGSGQIPVGMGPNAEEVTLVTS